MTDSMHAINRRNFALGLAGVGLLPALTACGGGDKDKSAYARFVNATQSFASLDAYADDATIAKEILIAQASGFADISSGSHTVKGRSTGGATNLIEQSQTFNGEGYYSIVAMGADTSIRFTVYKEDESDPDSGYAKFRLLNAFTAGDSVDVYLTTSTANLDNETPVFSGIGNQSFSSFRSVANGTYRLRVTTAGDTTEVRLDVAQLTVTDKAIYTYVVMPTKSGTLANGIMLAQRASFTSNLNTQARVRFVNGYAANIAAQPSVDGVKVGSAIGGYGVSAYNLVQAGARSIAFAANGQSYTSSLSVVAGTDMTVALTPQDGALRVISSLDNNLPAITTTKGKIRLFNLAPGANSVQLSYNSGTVLVDYLEFGSVSAYTQFYASTYDFSATSGSGATTTIADLVTLGGGVYTAFAFGNTTIDKFSIRRDH